MRLVIVSGLSGSGKSVALRTLEDLGYYSIDNLPVFLLKELALGLTGASDATYTLTAVGIDARNTEQHLRELPELIRHARVHGIECRVLFLEADTDTLIKRFSETRRKHPLTRDGSAPGGGDRTGAAPAGADPRGGRGHHRHHPHQRP